MNTLKKVNTITHLRFNLTFVLIFCTSTILLGQKAQNSVYQTEFKTVGKDEYTKQLISLSKEKINQKWNNYQGKAIHTDDSLFHFNSDLLGTAFPTNTAIHKNNYLLYYFSQKTAKCPTLFSLLNYYEPRINQNLNKNNLPQELKLLPVVLSAFNPNSNNQIGGTGYWHLNYPQAVKYGLTINDLVDERRDFDKSTKAATLYLKDLYKVYNNWELTLAAYSSGVVTTTKLLNRHNAKTYNEIYPYLPEQTKDLVQAFVAMNYIYNYDSYGAIALNPTIEVDTVLIERKLKFEAVNHVINTSSKDINFLNITLNKSTFPSNYTAYFPKGKGDKFLEFKDSIYFYQDSVMFKPKTNEPEFVVPKNGEPYVYTVRSGDVLGLIADRNNVRVSQLQAWNNLNGTMINVGQKLTIYGKSKTNVKPQQTASKPVVKRETKPTVKPKVKTKNQNSIAKIQTVYTVKSGDNLWIIAKKYSGVSAQNIMDFNGIDGNLTVGQKINIPKY
jgi:membrane-bound lytic murein transglycosylase D